MAFDALKIQRDTQSMDAQDDDNLILGEESDEDFDWEEVDVPQAEPQLDLSLEDDIEKAPSIFDRPNIEITIQSRKKAEDTVAK